MMHARKPIASVAALAIAALGTMAQAQSAPGVYPPAQQAPWQGQNAAPPPAATTAPAYDPVYAAQYADWQRRYADWQARYCVSQHANNTAAGAVVGGLLGAAIGAGVSAPWNRGAGAVIGGAFGATTGAAIGASSGPPAGCPGGYYVRAGAPVFYTQPYYAPAVVYAGPAYRPYVWINGAWVYRPYRYGYGPRPGYWRPGYGPRPAPYPYRTW